MRLLSGGYVPQALRLLRNSLIHSSKKQTERPFDSVVPI